MKINLASRALERKLRRMTRAVIRSDPVLKREWKKKRGRTTVHIPPSILIFAFSIGILGLSRFPFSNLESWMAIWILLGTVIALVGASNLAHQLYRNPDLWIWAFLPAPDEATFDLKWRKQIGFSAWSFLFLEGAMLLAGWQLNFSGKVLAASILLAAVQWLLAMVMSR